MATPDWWGFIEKAGEGLILAVSCGSGLSLQLLLSSQSVSKEGS